MNNLDVQDVQNNFLEQKILYLNESQTRSMLYIRKFLKDTTKYNFLLMGMAGSGKTTVITSAFNNTKLKIAFCAFTNKATQVLKNASEKFNISFSADFSTIHKLLMLEPKYLFNETEVSFKFDKTKIEHLKNYDVIIFDECSTISRELFQFIQQAWEWMNFKYDHKIKFIYLGDYWQLSPVGEESSIVFDTAIKQKWDVSKLNKVMRSGNEVILDINSSLISWIDILRNNKKYTGHIDDFCRKYPYNLLSYRDFKDLYVDDLDDLLDFYMKEWRDNKQSDIVILTHSRKNCDSINNSIQDKIDLLCNRDLPEKRVLQKFYVGDRCCIDKPIEVSTIVRQLDNSSKIEYVILDEHTNEYLYNGEIFDVMCTEDVKIKTPLNKFSYNPKYFDGQILKIRRINAVEEYEILYIKESDVKESKNNIRMKTSRDFYLNIMNSFIKLYAGLSYGYCITIYKSQGSEWNTVLINLNNIKWSIVGDHKSKTIDFIKKKALFKTTYTAISRASHNLKLFWR